MSSVYIPQSHANALGLDPYSPEQSKYGQNFVITSQDKNTTTATPTNSGYSYGGKSSSSTSTSNDKASALIGMLLQQQQLAEKRMAEQAAAANAAIDRNAEYAIGQMDEDRVAQQRQSYVSREKAMNTLPQVALAAGGGGMSETSLMGINSQYENSISQIADTFNRNKGDVLNEAANLKAANETNLMSQIMDFENQTSVNLMELANTPGVDPAIVSIAMSTLGNLSDGNATYVARLRASGLSDEQIRAMGYMV